MKKRLAAIAMAGAMAVGGSVAGVAVLGSSAHGTTLSRCQQFLNQDHLLDAIIATGTPAQARAAELALPGVEANIHKCFSKLSMGPP
jgi:hypothetical protein